MNTLLISRTVRLACASITIAAGTFAPFAHAADLPIVTKTPGISLASTDLPTALRPGMLSPQDPKAQLDPSLLQLPTEEAPAARGAAAASAVEAAEVGFNPASGQEEVHPSGAKMLQDSGIRRDKSGSFAPPTAPEGAGDVGAQTVFGSDDRAWVSNTWQYPWSTQCKLIMTWPNGYQSTGSGTVVGYKYVLTAGHCTYNAQRGGWASAIEVIPGLSGTYKPFGSYWMTYMRSYTNWTSYQDPQHDFALLTVNGYIGNYTGTLGYAHYASIWGLTGNIAGYPGDLYDGIYQFLASGACYDGFWWGYPQQVITWIDLWHGDSGAGVYNKDGYGNRYVFAVTAWQSTALNGATKITSEKFNSIANWIASGY